VRGRGCGREGERSVEENFWIEPRCEDCVEDGERGGVGVVGGEDGTNLHARILGPKNVLALTK
jgi:hypothetical protein